MIAFEFDYALLASSGVAESLHAAGVDVDVSSHHAATESEEDAAAAQSVLF